MNASILLICAVIVSLASGVFLAYGLCLLMFTMFRSRVRKAAGKSQTATPLRVAGS